MRSLFKIKTGRIVILLILLPLVLVIYFLPFQSKKEKFAFYKEPLVENENDVWRLPIIEPYELITADCCRGWNFQKRDFPSNFSADSINLKKNCILFYGYSNKYGFLDIERKKITMFHDYQQFTDSLTGRGINRNLYSTEVVYKNWRETGQLPWSEEILATQKGDVNGK